MNNFISTQSIILRLKDTFDVSVDSYRNKIIDFIGYGISSIRGGGIGYKDDIKELDINSYNSKNIGSDVLYIHNVLNKGRILNNPKKTNSLYDDPMKIEETTNKLIGLLKSKKYCKDEVYSDSCGRHIYEPYQTIMDLAGAAQDFLYAVNYDTVKKCNEFWWYQEGNIIKTNIESGNVLLFYKTFLTDEDGYPVIYNSFNYIEYLIWFIMHRLLLRGYKHPVLTIKETYGEIEKYKHKIENEIMIDSFDEQSFIKHWNTFTHGLSL